MFLLHILRARLSRVKIANGVSETSEIPTHAGGIEATARIDPWTCMYALDRIDVHLSEKKGEAGRRISA